LCRFVKQGSSAYREPPLKVRLRGVAKICPSLETSVFYSSQVKLCNGKLPKYVTYFKALTSAYTGVLSHGEQ